MGRALRARQVQGDILFGFAAPGEAGEILVSGPTVTPGYLDDPEATERTIRDGWLHTGDIATIDADGFITVVDRKKDIMINSAGKNMSPANIEGAVMSAGRLIATCA